MCESSLSQSFLKECFLYDADTGALTWRNRPRSHFNTKRGCNQTNSRDAGKEAGTINDKGYLVVYISGNSYRAHRVIWCWMTGRWPVEIDHESGVEDDNRWVNLRDVDHAENSKNRKLRADNKSGHQGVNYDEQSRMWKVNIGVNGKRKHLGYHDTFEEAVKVRNDSEIKYSFHRNHGRD